MATKLKVVSEYSDKGLKRARSDIGSFGRYTSGVFKRVGATIAGVFAVRSIIGFVRSSISAYFRQEKAVESLRQALLTASVAQQELNKNAKQFDAIDRPNIDPVNVPVKVETPQVDPVNVPVKVETPQVDPVKVPVEVETPQVDPVKVPVEVETPQVDPVSVPVQVETPQVDTIKILVEVETPNVEGDAFTAARNNADVYTSSLEKAASALQVLTRVGDESIMEIMAQGAQMGVAADNLDEYAAAVLMVSKTTGQGLREVAKQIKDQFAGQTNELSRLIPALNNATTAGERYEAIMAFTNARLKEQGELSMTNAERALAVKAAFGDLTEQVGAFFIESGLAQNIMDELLFAIEDIQAVGFGQWFEETFPKMDAFINRIVGILTALGMLDEKIKTRREMEVKLLGTRMGVGLTEAEVARGVGRPREQRTKQQIEEAMTELARRRATRDAERQARREERERRKAERLEQARATLEAMRSGFTPTTTQQQAATATGKEAGGQALSAGDLFERAFGATVAAANGTRQNPYFVVLNNPEDINTGLAE